MKKKSKFIKPYDRPRYYTIINLVTRKKKQIYVHSKDEYEMFKTIYNLK